MAKLLGSLNVGDVVTFGKLLGSPIRWIVIDKNHAGYPENSVTLLAEKLVKCGFYDGAEPNNNQSRHVYGNNDYLTSNLDQWLNKDGAAGQWWTAAHDKDAPPTNAAGYGNGGVAYNGYASDPAFLHQFSEDEKNALLSTKLWQQNENSYRKVFCLSMREYNFNYYGDSYDTPFSYFSSDVMRAAQFSAEALADNEYTTATPTYWTRTTVSGSEDDSSYTDVYVILGSGKSGAYMAAFLGLYGIRPAVNLSNAVRISETTDSNGAYQTIFNEAPSVPSGITVPEQIMGGRTVKITWGAATDVDNNLAGYILERRVNGGAWTQVYKGSLRNYTDTITYGWNTVAYRVAAYDAKSATSEYAQSATKTIFNNSPPAISGTDGNLGTFGTTPPTQSYTVTDANGGAVTVVETFGKRTRTFTATLGAENSFSLTASEWRKVRNGTHTITITATDQYGDSTTRTWTFTKAVHSATITINPITVDERPERCIVGVKGSFPAPSILNIEVCNNANDTSPTWENISSKIGEKHFFNNTTKTATDWAFGLRATLERNSAVGDVYLDYITINFD